MTVKRPRYYLGLDLGKERDHTALCVLELRTELTGEFDAVNWRHVVETRLWVTETRQLPLGTPYLAAASVVKEALVGMEAGTAKTLVVDAGGPGAPVVEVMKRLGLGVTVTPVVITTGQKPGKGTAPRTALLSNVRVMMEAGWLRLAKGMEELNKEMASVRGDGLQKVHDDLAMALALAAWPARKEFEREGLGV